MDISFRVLFLQEISQKHGMKTDGGMSGSGVGVFFRAQAQFEDFCIYPIFW